ncbi:hypothetical protein AAFG07_32245 [Bradyrhizobium sp. B097]|uniref:hypothetical protein n=1 Tax=Bradyrhizobium sp. B097 TaxID=3140244 RepID=UPI003182F48D
MDQIVTASLRSRNELIAWSKAGIRTGIEYERSAFIIQGHQPLLYDAASAPVRCWKACASCSAEPALAFTPWISSAAMRLHLIRPSVG